MKKFIKTTLALAATMLLSQYANADVVSTDVASVYITGNSDSSNNPDEGVFIRASGNSGSYMYLRSDGELTIGTRPLTVNTTSINTGTANINSTVANIGLNGNAVNIGRAGSINTIVGATNLTGALTQTGIANINTTGAATTNIGTAGGNINVGSVSSINSVLGATSINTSGNANTTIGNAANTTTIQSGTNVITGGINSILSTGTNTIMAATGNSISTAAGNNSMTATTGANSISAGTSNTISAVTSNNLSAATNTISAIVANNIQGPQNNIGTSTASANNIGNLMATTTVTSVAGNASQALANGTARTQVSNGVSDLSGASQKTNAEVLLRNSAGTAVDSKGKILQAGATGYVAPTGSTAALTLTNGYGNTHGLVVTESQTTLSGGSQSSSLSLNDRAATFSNAQTGAPITVTGVANGRADFDGVNVRQFAGAVAAVSAQANIPALTAGQDRTMGVGVANFMGKSALAIGMTMRGNGNSVFKATISSGLNAGGSQAVVGVGGAWGF